MNVRNIVAAGAALGLATTGIVLSTPASAAPGDPIWVPCATTNVSTDTRPDEGDCTTSAVTVDGGKVSFSGTRGVTANIEALVFPVKLEGGKSTISFEYTGPCGGGSPRVYVTLNGSVYHTADAVKPCDDDTHKVTYTLPDSAGTGTAEADKVSGWDVAAAGVVFDSGAEGAVTVSNVVIGGEEVDFSATEPKPTPTATQSQTTSPSPSASQSHTTSPSQSTGGAVPTTTQTSGAGLPVTGAPAKALFVLGALAAAVGGVALLVARRRRDEVEFEA